MSEMKYEITITATGSVHDKDGNLLNEVPIESVIVVTESELAALLDTPQGEDPS